jgi:pimeloyl-ACP methyl ester carboxylesterase
LTGASNRRSAEREQQPSTGIETLMTATTRPAPAPADAEPTSDLPRRTPIGRVVLGSLLAGLLLAAVMTLIVVPGAKEHVITGSVLLSFAAGWAALATFSARRTTSPQRWARVPALAMAVTGLGLLVLAPGNTALNHTGWVWPPLLLALAAWMGAQVRRSTPGRSRWLLYPVAGVLALGAVGGMLETVAMHRDANTFAMPGHLYDVGGHRLHLNCVGSGSPTVVLENGLGGSSPEWARVIAATSGTTRVCAYDRAGQGWSDDTSATPDSLAVVRDLHTLLQVAGEHGRYVLAGHSAGGAYVMTYAAQYPSEVAGLVFVDSVTPQQFTVLPDYARQYAMLRRLTGVAPLMTRMGVGQLVNLVAGSNVPGVAGREVESFGASPRSWRNQRDELAAFHAAFRQAAALTSFGDKPVAVLSATDSMNGTPGWKDAQALLVRLSSNSFQREVTSSHIGMLEDEQPASATAAAITSVVQAVRTGGQVSGS